MFLLTKPSVLDLENFLADRVKDTLSYSEVSATFDVPPTGYTIDHNRIKIGHGAADFETACQAIRNWKMFDLGWVELFRTDTPIEVDQNVAILVNHLGFWSLSSARIVYTIKEEFRYGFAYGTLTEHAEIGEERFSVEFDAATGEVWYDLLAFSRPAAFLAKLGYPISRYYQRRFAEDSKRSMVRYLEALSAKPSPEAN